MADNPASESSDAQVQDLLAERQTQVMNGAGAGAAAVVVTDALTALGYD